MLIDKLKAARYTWGETCEGWVLVNKPELSVKQEKMPVGTKERLHFHKIATQYFYMLSGSATFYLDNEKHILNAEQGIEVTPYTKHYIANESNSEVEFLVISRPSTNYDRINL